MPISKNISDLWKSSVDIDIDIAPSTKIESVIPCVRASMVRDDQLVRHPVGVYLQNIPIDPLTKLAAMPYTNAKEVGFFKFDFLNLHVLQHYSSKAQLRHAIKEEPNWSLLEDPEVVAQLFHIGKHGDVVSAVAPRTVESLADCLALIRPGKRALLDRYLANPQQTRLQLYQRSADEKYAFKRSHAIAYALIIVLQLHALGHGVSTDINDDMLEW